MSVQRLSRIVSTLINNTNSINNMLAVNLVHDINIYSQEAEEFNNKLKKDNEILYKKIYDMEKHLLSNNMKIKLMESQIFSLRNILGNIQPKNCVNSCNCYH
jgi:hypothetical protein